MGVIDFCRVDEQTKRGIKSIKFRKLKYVYYSNLGQGINLASIFVCRTWQKEEGIQEIKRMSMMIYDVFGSN